MTLASRKIIQTTQGVFRQKLKESLKQPRFYLFLADKISRMFSKKCFYSCWHSPKTLTSTGH